MGIVLGVLYFLGFLCGVWILATWFPDVGYIGFLFCGVFPFVLAAVAFGIIVVISMLLSWLHKVSAGEERQHEDITVPRKRGAEVRGIATVRDTLNIPWEEEQTAENEEKKIAGESTLRSVVGGVRIRSAEQILADVDGMDGREFEEWCADLLRKDGFINVTVTPASGDQGVDITAEKESVRYAVQCKCYSNDLGNHPIQEVHAGKALYSCHVGVVMTNREFTAGARELAKATGTLLWGREKLKKMLKHHGQS